MKRTFFALITLVITAAFMGCGDQAANNKPANTPANNAAVRATPVATPVNSQVPVTSAMPDGDVKPDDKGKKLKQKDDPKAAQLSMDEAPSPTPKKKN